MSNTTSFGPYDRYQFNSRILPTRYWVHRRLHFINRGCDPVTLPSFEGGDVRKFCPLI